MSESETDTVDADSGADTDVDTETRSGPQQADAGLDDAPRLFQVLHPIGWVALCFAVVALIATGLGWDLLIARMPWGLWALTVATIVAASQAWLLHGLRRVIEAVSTFTGKIAIFLAWFIFFVQLFNVITRYTNNWFERDILFGEATSMAWMSFAALFLFGVSYGVKNGINPRIDFWWAEFTPRRKAWIDFTLHTFLFMPFLIVGLRVLKPFAARSLGYNRFANDGAGAWPEGWAVWRTWETSTDAGQLPQGPIQALILVGFGLWTAQIVAEIIKTGFVLAGRQDLGEISDAEEAPLRIE